MSLTLLGQHLRYVAQGSPTLLDTFDDFCRQHGNADDPGARRLVTRSLHHRPDTIRKMLRHERPLPVKMWLCLTALLGLSAEETGARYLANAPADKIADLCAVARATDRSAPRTRRTTCFLCRPTALGPLPS
jgi:hypothetical protein